MSDLAAMARFSQVEANPYPWPFDAQWTAHDTALLLLGYENATISALGAHKALEGARGLLALAQTAGLHVAASSRTQWSDALALPGSALVFRQAGDNAFYATGLEDALRQRGIRNLLIAGLTTDGLVHASQRAANDMGFECLTVADACQGTNAARHAAQLRITTFGNGLFGAVASVADIRAALLHRQGA